MIPNLLNTALGIALVYCAILVAGPLHDSAWPLMAAGIGIIALGLWARRNDKLKWFNLVNVVLGAALVLLGIARALTPVHPLVMFWWVFWVGIIVAVLAFWSALYTRETSAIGP
ncbi:MAG: hypothetical protein HY067_23070 [Betaproteobacteria bacterium]|nr:hypothetical protein [Betaproteobacteria bacterium]